MTINVAPHAGALVETLDGLPAPLVNVVAPHAGALVETYIVLCGIPVDRSRLTQAR